MSEKYIPADVRRFVGQGSAASIAAHKRTTQQIPLRLTTLSPVASRDARRLRIWPRVVMDVISINPIAPLLLIPSRALRPPCFTHGSSIGRSISLGVKIVR
jgi:hypothetical protein